MSMQQVPAATLSGYQGPFYPKAITKLAEALVVGPPTINGVQLARAAQGVPGYVRYIDMEGAVAGDGYNWYCLLEFVVGGGKVLVAVPRFRDGDRKDGYPFDRSPAVYHTGGGSVLVAADILRALANALLGQVA